jgi:hypothetical protein
MGLCLFGRRGVKLCDSQIDWFLEIYKEITERRDEEGGRPVMVFFESLAVLEKFYNDPSVERLRPLRLDERVSSASRPSVVSRATSNRVVTLLTRDYGRGTDFMCEDIEINRRGGVHVIQTFVSDEISEEKQIQGPSRQLSSLVGISMHVTAFAG